MYYDGCVWVEKDLETKCVDCYMCLLLEILSASRLEIVLLPRGCYTTWLVIFAGTNFHKTGQNSILKIFAVGKSGTHKLGSSTAKS